MYQVRTFESIELHRGRNASDDDSDFNYVEKKKKKKEREELEEIESVDRKNIDVYDKRITSLNLKDYFNPAKTSKDFKGNMTSQLLEKGIQNATLIGVNKLMEHGLINLAFDQMTGVDPIKPDYSVTLQLDFANSGIDVEAFKKSNNYTTSEAEIQLAALTELASNAAYRFTIYTEESYPKVLIESLGNVTMRANATTGDTKRKDAQIEFVPNTKFSGTDHGSEVAKDWSSEEEVKMVNEGLSLLSPEFLKKLSSLRIFRVDMSQDDHNRLAALPTQAEKDIFVPEDAAEYSSMDHAIAIYDWGIKHKSVNLYGDKRAGFATQFQRTMVHELGHAVDNNTVRLEKGEYETASEEYDQAYTDYTTAKSGYETYKNGIRTPAYQAALQSIKDLDAAFVDYYNSNKSTSGIEKKKKIQADIKMLNLGGVTSSKFKLRGIYHYDKIKDESYLEASLEFIESLSDLSQSVRTTAVANFEALTKACMLYNDTQKFYSSANKWAKSEDGQRPLVPDTIDQQRATAFLDGIGNEREKGALKTKAASEYTSAKSISGFTYDDRADNSTLISGIPFREAAKKDATGSQINRITKYSEKNWKEFFSESFSLYVTDPGRMSQLRPHLYSFFEKEYSMWGKQYPIVK